MLTVRSSLRATRQIVQYGTGRRSFVTRKSPRPKASTTQGPGRVRPQGKKKRD